jgi:hypothetical protein
MEYERGVRLKLFLAAGVRFSLKRLPQLRIAAKPSSSRPADFKNIFSETMAERNDDCEKVTLVTEAFNDLWC